MGRILVVDDEESISSMLEVVIGDQGHDVMISPDGEHALQRLTQSERFDLVITDIKMPKMDGRQLITSVRQKKEFSDLPIIIMSGYVGMAEIDDLMKSGAKAYLSKPINLKVLEAYIKDIVKS